ncbi:MAG: hypothetical protein ACOX6N_04635, partial [Patescibacteria group bacterium]
MQGGIMSDQFQIVYTCRKCHEGPCKVATGGDNFQTPDYCPFQLDADSHFQRVDSLALLASAQPKSSIHARRAMVELAKAWNEVKKDFPQPQKRE